MMSVQSGCATLIICALSLSAANSLRCFQCNSATDPECATLKPTDTNSSFYKECNRTSLGRTPIFCRKTALSFKDDKEKTMRITRSCGWEIWKENKTNCLEVDSDFKYERTCQCFTDGCNSAPRSTSSLLHLYTIVLPVIILISYRSTN